MKSTRCRSRHRYVFEFYEAQYVAKVAGKKNAAPSVFLLFLGSHANRDSLVTVIRQKSDALP